jgi:hypothetical protein
MAQYVTADLLACPLPAGRSRNYRQEQHDNCHHDSSTSPSWKGVDEQTVQEIEFLQTLSHLNLSKDSCGSSGFLDSVHRHQDATQQSRESDVEFSGSPSYPKEFSREDRKSHGALSFDPSPESPRIVAAMDRSKWRTESNRLHGASFVASEDSEGASRKSSSPRFLRRMRSSYHDLSPTLRARRFTESLPGFDYDDYHQSQSSDRAASPQRKRSTLSGRANMGEVVQGTSDAMNMLLAVETAIFEMLKDPKKESRPATCKLSKQDFKASQKVKSL